MQGFADISKCFLTRELKSLADFEGRSFFSVDNPAVILETVKKVCTHRLCATFIRLYLNIINRTRREE